MKELRGLQSRGVWQEVWEREVPEDVIVMGTRFVLTIKEKGTPNEVCKARLVAQGFRDSEKQKTVHFACLVRPESLRIALSVSAALHWKVGSIDITQAYIQGESLARDVYIRPPEEMRLEGKLLHLMKPLYGLTDFGDLWFTALSNFKEHDLGLKQTAGDPGMYFDPVNRRGIMSKYVDDILLAGEERFLENIGKMRGRFQAKDPQFGSFTYGGLQREQEEDAIRAHQSQYASGIKLLPKDAEFDMYRRVRAKLQWLVLSSPDICGAVGLAAQVTEQSFIESQGESIRMLNSITKCVRKGPMNLQFLPLNLEEARIVAYSDASFKNATGAHSQIGYTLHVMDNNGVSHLIAFSSKKSSRVVSSVYSAEAMALARAFDTAVMLRYDLDAITHRRRDIELRTDSLAVFKAITQDTKPREHRLAIDLLILSQSWRRREISQISFVRSAYNAADCCTKTTNSGAMLRIMETGRDDAVIEQWVHNTDTSQTQGGM